MVVQAIIDLGRNSWERPRLPVNGGDERFIHLILLLNRLLTTPFCRLARGLVQQREVILSFSPEGCSTCDWAAALCFFSPSFFYFFYLSRLSLRFANKTARVRFYTRDGFQNERYETALN